MASVGTIYASLKLDDSDFQNKLKLVKSASTETGATVQTTFTKINPALKQTNDNILFLNKSLGETAKIKPLEALPANLNKANTSIMSLAKDALPALGISMGILDSIQVGRNFERQMSEVKAASGASKEDLKLLTDEARRLGATTTFSATQAAQGMTELAKAGLNTKQVMQATGDVLNLAQAGGLGLAEATTIAADTMAGFGLQAKDVGRISDVLAKAANSSTISVQDMGEAMKYVAGVSKDVGMSLEETSALIAVLGNAGIKGSMAGTTLKTALLSLTGTSKEGEKALSKIGLSMDSFKDKNGNLKNTYEIFELLAQSTKKLGSAEKADVLATVFGKESLSGVLAILSETEKSYTDANGTIINGIQKMKGEMLTAGGSAQKFGDELTNNLDGAIKNFSSAMEEIKLIGADIFIPIIKPLLELSTLFVQVFGESLKAGLSLFIPGLKDASTTFSGFIKSIQLFIQEYSPFIKILTSSGAVFLTMKLGIAGLVSALGFIPGAAAMAGSAMTLAFGPVGVAIMAIVAAMAGISAGLNALEDRQKRLKQEQSDYNSVVAIGLKQHQDYARIVDLTNRALNVKDTNDVSGQASLKSLKNELKDYIEIDKYFLTTNDGKVFAKNELNDLYKELTKVTEKTKEVKKETSANPLAGLGKSAEAAQMSIDDLIKALITVDAFSKKDVEFGFKVKFTDQKQIDTITSEIEAMGGIVQKKMSEISEKVKSGKTTKTEKSIAVEFDVRFPDSIPAKEQARLKKLLTDANAQAAKTPTEIGVEVKTDWGNIWNESVGVVKSFQLVEGEAKTMATTINAVARGIGSAINSIGGGFVKLLQAQGQLASVKQQNLTQNVEFLTAGLSKAIDNEANYQKSAYDAQLRDLEAQHQALLAEETNYQLELATLRAGWDTAAKEENERMFQEALALIQVDYQTKADYLLANTADHEQYLIQKAFLDEDQRAREEALRTEYDERLLSKVNENKDRETGMMEEKKNSNIAREKQIADEKQRIENQKAQIDAQAAQRKEQLERASRLMLWQSGKAAFEIQKKSQLAQIQIQLASIIMSAIQAVAGMAASTLGFGLPVAIGIGALLTGMGIAASMTSMSAVMSAQYPPPPLFADGGIATKPSIFGESGAELAIPFNNPGKDFGALKGEVAKQLVSGQGNVTNIYIDGSKIVVEENDPAKLADIVGMEIRKQTYMALSR